MPATPVHFAVPAGPKCKVTGSPQASSQGLPWFKGSVSNNGPLSFSGRTFVPPTAISAEGRCSSLRAESRLITRHQAPLVDGGGADSGPARARKSLTPV